jgi:hypothetical protein
MAWVDELISYDDTQIVVTRHTKVADAGGYTWTTATLDPQTVRLYTVSPRNQREYQTEEGEVKMITLGILAGSTADMVFGHDSYDTFPFGGRTYRIVGVRHYDDVNIPEHYQADCVAV